MNARKLIELYVRPLPEIKPRITDRYWPAYCSAAARLIAEALVQEKQWHCSLVVEAPMEKGWPTRGSHTGQPMKRRELLGLTQREVGLILGLSERAVRKVEKRALAKLRAHPELRRIWSEIGGPLDEGFVPLTTQEVEALLNLTQTPEELGLMYKVICTIQ
jgi:hypothetical protein